MGWLSRHLKKNAYQDITVVSIIGAFFMSNFDSINIKIFLKN